MTSLDVYNIQVGWKAFDREGDHIGDVVEIGPSYLVLQRGLIFKSELYVPFSAVKDADEGALDLNVVKADIEGLGWTTRPMLSGGPDEQAAEANPDMPEEFKKLEYPEMHRAEEASRPVLPGRPDRP